MGRISILCLVLLVIMVSVSFADNNEVRSTDLKKVKGGGTDRSISKVNDDDHDDDNDADHDHDNNNNSDADHDHDNDDDDHDHDHDNDDDHDHDDDHDNDNDDDGEDDNDDDDGEDDNDDDDDDGDEDDGDDGDDEKKTLEVHELKKGNLTVKFSNRGASIMSLLFPDKSGKMEDIVLGYDYINDTVFCGATVARVGNRREKTVANDGKNTINGGMKDVIWKVNKKHNHKGKKPYIVFTYTSPDGDQGFPGKLDVTVTYKLVGENKLRMVMEAKARPKATLVNLVHQSYWNLGGHDNEDILSEEIQILGSGYAHLDDNLTPTGKILAVKGTPYDFRQLRPIKDNINELKTGYGINYCLDGVANKMRKVMELVDRKSKVKMELSTDQSGLKFYTGGRLKIIKGKNGSVQKANSGLCLESHAINYQYLPSQIVKPGKNYKHTMLFKFSIVP